MYNLLRLFLASALVQQTTAGTARHIFTFIAGVLVADGVLTSSQTNDFLGSCLFLFGVGWSWVQKREAAQAQVGSAPQTPKN